MGKGLQGSKAGYREQPEAIAAVCVRGTRVRTEEPAAGKERASGRDSQELESAGCGEGWVSAMSGGGTPGVWGGRLGGSSLQMWRQRWINSQEER